MSTLSTLYPTMKDHLAAMDDAGNIAPVVDILAQQNEILDDMVWGEANSTLGHKTNSQFALPTPTWRKMNQGIAPSFGKVVSVIETCGTLADYFQVDKQVAELNGNTAAFMLLQSSLKLEGINQEFSSSLFYANESTNPEEFTGFAPRYADQSLENGCNIITDAATPDNNDNTSVWLIGWALGKVQGIFPKGSKMGLTRDYKGILTVPVTNPDGTTGLMEAHVEYFQWQCGLSVADWRYVVRINFDLEDCVASGTTGPVLARLMAKAMRRIPNLNACRPAFYANRDTLEMFDQQAMEKANMGFTTIEDAQGKMLTRFRGIPIRRCDSILSTEAGI